MIMQLLEKATGCKVECEYKFHPKRKWMFDYCIPEKMIAIEIEGGAFTQGRHTRGVGFINDMEKYNNAVLLGYKLLRFTPKQMKEVKTYEIIKELTEKLK
jgi:hypothetical protein